VGDRSRGRFATPADFPLQDCIPYPHVHVRRESLGFVSRSRAIFCRPVPNPNRSIRNFLHRCPAGTLEQALERIYRSVFLAADVLHQPLEELGLLGGELREQHPRMQPAREAPQRARLHSRRGGGVERGADARQHILHTRPRASRQWLSE
jgi:hypothetical protein